MTHPTLAFSIDIPPSILAWPNKSGYSFEPEGDTPFQTGHLWLLGSGEPIGAFPDSASRRLAARRAFKKGIEVIALKLVDGYATKPKQISNGTVKATMQIFEWITVDNRAWNMSCWVDQAAEKYLSVCEEIAASAVFVPQRPAIMPSTPSSVKTTPTLQPGVKLAIVGNVAQEDNGIGHIILHGLVKNLSAETAEAVRIEARTFKGEALFRIHDTFADPSTIRPGQTASFTLYTDKGWASYQLVFHWQNR